MWVSMELEPGWRWGRGGSGAGMMSTRVVFWHELVYSWSVCLPACLSVFTLCSLCVTMCKDYPHYHLENSCRVSKNTVRLNEMADSNGQQWLHRAGLLTAKGKS